MFPDLTVECDRNHWSDVSGISGRMLSELVVGCFRNYWSNAAGISIQLKIEIQEGFDNVEIIIIETIARILTIAFSFIMVLSIQDKIGKIGLIIYIVGIIIYFSSYF